MSSDKLYIFSIIGAVAAALFGRWDGAMLTLCIFMAADYITGIVLAGVFKKSPKSSSGALDSKAGLLGLLRKAGMFVIIILAHRLDLAAEMQGVLRSGVIYALTINEALSITENLGAMGVPLPHALMDAIDRLRGQNEKKEGEENGTDKRTDE